MADTGDRHSAALGDESRGDQGCNPGYKPEYAWSPLNQRLPE